MLSGLDSLCGLNPNIQHQAHLHTAFLVIRLDLSNTVKPRSSSYCFCLWLLSCDVMCPTVDTHYCDWLSLCPHDSVLFSILFAASYSLWPDFHIRAEQDWVIIHLPHFLWECFTSALQKDVHFLFSPKIRCSGCFSLMCYVVLLCRAVTVKLCALFRTIMHTSPGSGAMFKVTACRAAFRFITFKDEHRKDILNICLFAFICAFRQSHFHSTKLHSQFLAKLT